MGRGIRLNFFGAGWLLLSVLLLWFHVVDRSSWLIDVFSAR